MKTATKNGQSSGLLSENAFARKAFEEIRRIEEEANQKKLAQLESLKSARGAIMARINEFEHQLTQIDSVVGTITGRPAAGRVRSERKNWDEVRERIARWMQGRQGQRFTAGDLLSEFPELDGRQVSIFLKPLIETGDVQSDASEGPRRTKYFVEA